MADPPDPHQPAAHGGPLARGNLRSTPEDFIVEEQLGFSPSGEGQHVLLRVRKRAANTQWVARELARICGCRPGDVGYAGLKDRHAVAVQWFSVPRSRVTTDDWTGRAGADFEVLEACAHSRKLPRGALAGNRFEIRIRGMAVEESLLAERLATIAARGVPNYFGAQRFGREGANLARISDDPRSLHRSERPFVLSAARSLVFNAVLAARVLEGTWDQLEPGDIANLDGRGSIFAVDGVDAGLMDRGRRLEIHPTGRLWGRGSPATGGRIGALEAQVAGQFPQACTLTANAGMSQERRSLRLVVQDLLWNREPEALVIRFRLTRGSYATAVLREIVAADVAADLDQSLSST
jgi:tRNA pseudouridine13 synthase